MGILSDPSLTPQNKFGKFLSKHHAKICWLCYIASIIWFLCLAYPDFNQSTYLSENALSPGLVYPEIKQDSNRLMQLYMEKLQREREQHKTITPYAWISHEMKEIGLEVYVHNYTLIYPFAKGKIFQGKNVYGILRAPRTSSTEGIVFSAPYRLPSSVHNEVTASVPVLLAFAEFARKKNYWAKDLIFLVTEHEQLGMEAFLSAYFSEDPTKSKHLKYGYLPGRAGALQAAINLEIQDLNIEFIDVKIEGLNGQLPNLDLFNVVQRITAREGITSGYKHTTFKKRRSHHSTLQNNVKNMLSMLLTQSTGVPNGNHGLFHRHRIEALTLEGVRRHTNGAHSYNGLALLKTIEGISRSLNNLLEKFHQSYFFYILIHNDRFVSIGDYMPCMILLVFPLFVKAFLLWLMANGDAVFDNEDDLEIEQENAEQTAFIETTDSGQTSALTISIYICMLASMYCHGPVLDFLVINLNRQGLNTPQSISLLMGFWVFVALTLPFLYKLSEKSLHELHFGCLIVLGLTLAVVGLLNFALAFLLGIITAPLAIHMPIKECKSFRKNLSILYCLILNPLVLVYTIVLILTIRQFPELTANDLLIKSIFATMDGITYSLMDNLIYGNWLYTVAVFILLPLWCGFWTVVLRARVSDQIVITQKKLK
ncbi:glycosylphosphatidylinositol anchor attachment 1 protein isoform X1 [Glossina fuscipes]|uniref:Glycosylphosphatidylinositol anchor attachment 1 protein isoform X1 n=1 Tax=Glossina fuscipes TaxID=7396 RepID=A0A9C5YWI3_9MUSC|nr:glycosylphosphatidylinositol anchor attachment 1 protein isoform X1 [Glossina fuscipes]KAI9590272.1 hypothetical protein GQX74_008440 [Glossina fuscipes]